MNIDYSIEAKTYGVKSKYFTRNTAMDESLSDFQEPKKTCTGPKKTAKPKASKPKKALKRPRGQKDIRTALKSTKEELESYSKDFTKVCKKAGIDVDSEELQLAIALSKSLHDAPASSIESGESSQEISTQQRIGKIRTTLREYGFKVPESKTAGNSRNIKKHRKKYKLVETSETEKKEIIAEKYSQVLFKNITDCTLYSSDIDTSQIQLYYLATNASYDILKITDTFYIDNLIKKSLTTGSLLRDWSKIPGRPESPKLFEPMSMNFSEIPCSQDELDVVLSGTIKNCKDIVKKKIEDYKDKHRIVMDVDDDITEKNYVHKDVNKEEPILIEQSKETGEIDLVAIEKEGRSCSPDMFDDDVSGFFDNSKGTENPNDMSENQKGHKNAIVEFMDLTQPEYEKSNLFPNNATKRKSNDLMELTECVVQAKDQTAFQLSQKSDITKRKSNDFMEITECVAEVPQPLQNNKSISPQIIAEDTVIDVTDRGNIEILTDTNKDTNIDLTNSPSSEDKPKTVKENINGPDLDTENIESMDLTQSSNTSDELPFVSLSTVKNKNLNDTIIVDINDYAYINKNTNLQTEAEIQIDLTQCAHKNNEVSHQSQSFFEEYDHDHSESIEDRIEEHSGTLMYEDNADKIDLTQNNINNNISSIVNIDLSSSLLSQHKTASQIIVEHIPVELHLFNSPTKHSKSDKIDVTIQSITSNYNISETSRNGSFVEQISDSQKEPKNLSSQNDALDDIDLTQSDTDEENCHCSKRITLNNSQKQNYDEKRNSDNFSEENDLPTVEIKSSQRCSSLGKKDDVSIDYDELINNEAKIDDSCMRSNNPGSIIYENPEECRVELKRNNSILSNCSQDSEVFDLTDKELDYSLHQSKLEVPKDNFEFGGISIMDDLSNFGRSKKSIAIYNDFTKDNINEIKDVANDYVIDNIPTVGIPTDRKINRCKEISPIKHRRITEISTPQKATCSNVITVTTPKNTELLIKTNNVTPMVDYESMSTPDIHKELDKYGIKPFKRKRAIQLLTHIYNQTHPIVENTDELASPPKRHKPNEPPISSPRKRISPRKLITSRKLTEEIDNVNVVDKNIADNSKKNDNNSLQEFLNTADRDKENVQKTSQENVNKTKGKGKGKGKSSRVNQKTNDEEKLEASIESIQNRIREDSSGDMLKVPVIKEIECSPEDWVFQKREKAKVHSCRVPLHIAFHNYVSSRRDLREAILCYEPVEIDLIHKDLVGYGHRYDPKELLKFLDKKCITVKTTDNDGRSNKR